MVSAELLKSLQGLDRADKLRVVQVLSELAQQESELPQSGQSYPVCLPYSAFEAGNTMLKVLQASKAQNHAEG